MYQDGLDWLYVKTKSKKNYTVAVCLSAVFGTIGIQHFYLGRYVLGLIDLSLSILAVYFFISGQFLYADLPVSVRRGSDSVFPPAAELSFLLRYQSDSGDYSGATACAAL